MEKIGTATDFGLAKKAKYQACVYVVTSFISCEINCKPQSGILVFEKLYKYDFLFEAVPSKHNRNVCYISRPPLIKNLTEIINNNNN